MIFLFRAYTTLKNGTHDDTATFALVIGIDDYKHIRKLAGCVQDAEDVVKFLKEEFHTPDNRIRLLRNSDASRDAIIATFQSHLINNDDINRGDRIFFYYAGHGGRVPPPQGWMGEKNRDPMSMGPGPVKRGETRLRHPRRDLGCAYAAHVSEGEQRRAYNGPSI